MAYSVDLVRFITAIPVGSDGRLVKNNIDSGEEFVSELFTPSYSLSVLARLVQKHIEEGKIQTINIPVDSTTVVYKAFNSDLSSTNPSIYLLLRATVLEAFAVLYAMDKEIKILEYASKSDILRAKTNLKYIADYLGTEAKYYSMLESIRDMDISFGYIENQLDLMLRLGGRN